MTVTLINQGRQQNYTGLSGDAKPVDATVLPGALFTERDTGSLYVYDGVAWSLANSPAAVAAALTASTLAVLREEQDLLRELLHEVRAVRLGMQQWLDQGIGTETDLLELAISTPDRDIEEL